MNICNLIVCMFMIWLIKIANLLENSQENEDLVLGSIDCYGRCVVARLRENETECKKITALLA